MVARTFIELLIDEPRLEVSCEGTEQNPRIQWRCAACGVGVSGTPDELLEIRFDHQPGCAGLGGERRGGTARAAEVLERLAFISSGEFAPAGVDSLQWRPEAAARLLRFPELFMRPGGREVPASLQILRDAMVAVVEDLTVATR